MLKEHPLLLLAASAETVKAFLPTNEELISSSGYNDEDLNKPVFYWLRSDEGSQLIR